MSSSWKQRLIELESLTKSNGEAAWKTAGILRDVWRDAEFQADAGSYEKATGRLQKFAGRFCISVSDMIAMIAHFPNRDDWKDGRLDLLRDKTCKAIAARPPVKAPVSRRSVSLKEHEAALEKIRELQKLVRDLRRQLAAAESARRGRAS